MNMIAAPRRRLVLVGNGMAGIRALEEILDRAPQAFTVTVFGAEPHGAYNRILLSPVLAGEKSFESIVTNDHAWYERNGIELITNEAVTAIDRENRVVTGANGTMRPYDVLLLATGSSWRSISVGMMCRTVVAMPLRARPLAASSPSSPPPITTASLPAIPAAIIALVSSRSR